MTITAEAAKTLAVTYHAYLTAADGLDVAVWGPMLLKAQEATGVQLLDPLPIQVRIAAAGSITAQLRRKRVTA